MKKLPEKGDTSDLRQTAAAQTRIFFKTTLRVRVRLGNFMKNLKVTNERHKKKNKKEFSTKVGAWGHQQWTDFPLFFLFL